MLNEARSLFVANGYDRTSMDEIATQSGVSKRTIYSRYGSKADLFSLVAQQLGDTTMSALEAAEIPQGTPFEVMHALAEQLTAFASDKDIVAMERMTLDMARSFPELWDLRRSQSRRTVDVVVRRLVRIRPDADATQQQLERDALVFLSMTVIPTLHRSMMSPGTELADADAFLVRAVEIFLKGFL
ncbi:TetR/AcrR family transcriptional regulator [Roseivivax sediminis]|uniref:DNA-binding transcriptional regulator, AcrR family n=1 Tax=Roseivivax sediminis TaxID=936889 RepID=A0A1I2D6G3_9RHOB|nr:TetR/AcrR family transcriptional regulator [Roseivivax sediminis]SFE75673.1 DNA-binding transcriptional regulator, AcrR family [Roseivivax sediminis]